jgi:hypothetical protein
MDEFFELSIDDVKSQLETLNPPFGIFMYTNSPEPDKDQFFQHLQEMYVISGYPENEERMVTNHIVQALCLTKRISVDQHNPPFIPVTSLIEFGLETGPINVFLDIRAMPVERRVRFFKRINLLSGIQEEDNRGITIRPFRFIVVCDLNYIPESISNNLCVIE